jgi:hypothetical protein
VPLALLARFHEMTNSLRGWHAVGRSTKRMVPRSRSTQAWIVVRSFTFTVSFVFAFESSCASATLAAPTTRAAITVPNTVDFILPPEMKHPREAHQVSGHP